MVAYDYNIIITLLKRHEYTNYSFNNTQIVKAVVTGYKKVNINPLVF